MRHFSVPAGALFPPVLSWTHYRLLITVARPEARSFYEIEAAREAWSVREMERQIAIVGQEQERIRGNMAQTPKESELFRRYLTKFSEQEDSIEALRTKVTASIQEEQKLRKGLDDYLIGLDLA